MTILFLFKMYIFKNEFLANLKKNIQNVTILNGDDGIFIIFFLYFQIMSAFNEFAFQQGTIANTYLYVPELKELKL